MDQANLHIEGLRNTELHKVLKEPGMDAWLHKTFRETKVGTPHLSPASYAATQRSSTHILIRKGFTLCQHKQSDGKAKRLVNPMVSEDVMEAVAWDRPWCDMCLRRAPASWWPPS